MWKPKLKKEIFILNAIQLSNPHENKPQALSHQEKLLKMMKKLPRVENNLYVILKYCLAIPLKKNSTSGTFNMSNKFKLN